MTSPRTLYIDIETSPALGEIWGLWDQNVGISQLRDPTRMICFGAKWRGNPKVEFYSEHKHGKDETVEQAHRLLDEADIVVHFNGSTFDMPHMRREFVKREMQPYSPVQEVDLCSIAKRRFRFMSNKLAYVTDYLGLPQKAGNEGHGLWAKCLRPDVPEAIREKAWRDMERYCKQDVRILEPLDDRIRPWARSAPNLGLFNPEGGDLCPRCGKDDKVRQGFAYTNVSAFQQYQCKACGHWFRSGKAVTRVDMRTAS